MKLIWAGRIPGKPPSTNQAYRTAKGQRGVYMSKEAKEYKAMTAQFAKYMYGKKPTEKLLRVTIEHVFGDKRRRDTMNYSKVLLDALEGIVYVNDFQIEEIEMSRIFGDRFYTDIKIYEI